MTKLKIILQSNVFLSLLFIGTCLYVCFHLYKAHPNVIGKEVSIQVHIEKIVYREDRMIIDGSFGSRVRCFYFLHQGERMPDYHLGDVVRIRGVLQTPSPNTNFNLFHYQHSLKGQKIDYIMNLQTINLVEKNQKWYYKIKNKIIERMNLFERKEYMYAFLLGDNSYVSSDMKQIFQNIGINHLFAISGMHVSFLFFCINKILSYISSHKKINSIICIFLLLFYTFLTDFSPSVLRATFFLIFHFINKELHLELSPIRILLFLFCLLLLYYPFYVYHIGFLFSFTISFFLLLSLKGNKKNRYQNLITTGISFLASTPILLHSFFTIHLGMPIYNLLFVPFVSFLLFPFTFFVFLFPCLQNIYQIFLFILEKMAIVCMKIPVSLVFPKMPLWMVCIYYLFLFLGIYQSKKRYFVYILFLLFILYLMPYCRIYSTLTMIDVGQGDSILLELKTGENVLIDTGGAYGNSSLAQRVLLPYLKSRGIRKLDTVILTHGDYDHMGEAMYLIENFKVKSVIFNIGEYDALEQSLIEVLKKKKIKYYQQLKKLTIGKYHLQFLNTKKYDNENDNSNVIYVNYKNYKFLFMGDAGIKREKDILEKYNLKDIDILKVGHHGSNTSSSKEFIDSINPKYSIISVGKNNKYGHPKESVLDTLKDSKIYRTDQDGSIMFKIRKNKLEIKTCIP